MYTPEKYIKFINMINQIDFFLIQDQNQGKEKGKKNTSERAVAYVSALSWPETVKKAGFPKKSCKREKN